MKRIVIIFFLLIAGTIFCPAALAEEYSELEDLSSRVNGQIREAMDEETKEEMDRAGFTGDMPGTELDERGIFRRLWSRFTDGIRENFSLLGQLLAVSCIYACVGGLTPAGGQLERVFGTVCMLCVISVVSGALSKGFLQLQGAIDGINDFMISYIPIFSAVTAAGGNTVSAGSYGAGTLLLCETAAAVSSRVLMPFLNSVTAMTIVSSLDPALRLSGFSESIKKAVTRALTVIMIIFVGLMGIKGIAAASADDLKARTIRFAASSFIPVIGGYVSDTYLAVKGGMRAIRSAAGILGMGAVCVIALRPIMLLLGMKLMLWVGSTANDLLGADSCAGLLRNINGILSIALGVLIAFAASFVISTASVLMTAGGGV